jgi:hypothetical protein
MCQPSRKIFLAADQQNKKSRRVDDPATRLPTQISHKSWACMVNDQLFSAAPWLGRRYPVGSNERPAGIKPPSLLQHEMPADVR